MSSDCFHAIITNRVAVQVETVVLCLTNCLNSFSKAYSNRFKMSTNDNQIDDTLSDEFERILKVQDELNNSPLPVVDAKYQAQVAKAISSLEDLTNKVNTLQLFSTNEQIAEVSTEKIKYLLLPALLAEFSLKHLSHDRVHALELSKIYYRDFVKRCNEYELCDIPLSGNKDDDEEGSKNKIAIQQDSLVKASETRNAKIASYRKMKELDEELSQLKTLLEEKRSNGLQPEDEVERKFYLKLVHKYLSKAVSELENIEMEMPMATMRKAMAGAGNERRGSGKNPKPVPLRPITIVRTQIEKKVFGMGYPSHPTMTVDEFIDQKEKDGTLAFNNKQV